MIESFLVVTKVILKYWGWWRR